MSVGHGSMGPGSPKVNRTRTTQMGMMGGTLESKGMASEASESKEAAGSGGRKSTMVKIPKTPKETGELDFDKERDYISRDAMYELKYKLQESHYERE